mgnify:CR=1 FL=1
MIFKQNKRKRLHKNRVQLPQDYLGTPNTPFLCLGTPTWPPWRHGKTLYSYNTDKKWLEQLLIFSFLCFRFSEAAENPSINRIEVANASEILNRYLKCYDKRTRPNVTGWFVNIKFNYVSFCRAIYIFLKIFFGLKRNNNVFQSIGACFSKVPKLFGWHNSLCILKTKASRGTKLCNHFYFYCLCNILKDQLYK